MTDYACSGLYNFGVAVMRPNFVLLLGSVVSILQGRCVLYMLP